MKKLIPVILYFTFIQFSYADYQEDLGFTKTNLGAPIKSAQDVKQQNSVFITNGDDAKNITEKKIISNKNIPVKTNKNNLTKKSTMVSVNSNSTTSKNKKIARKQLAQQVSSPNNNNTTNLPRKSTGKVITNTTKKGTKSSNRSKVSVRKKETTIINNTINSTKTPVVPVISKEVENSASPNNTTNMKASNDNKEPLSDTRSISSILPQYKDNTSARAPATNNMSPNTAETPILPDSSIPHTDNQSSPPTLQQQHQQQEQLKRSLSAPSPNASSDTEAQEEDLNKIPNEVGNTSEHDDTALSGDTNKGIENPLPNDSQYENNEELSNTFID